MCDTALARLCTNKEGLYREFQSQERWSSGGELWPKATAFPTKCSRCRVSFSLSFPFPQNLSSDTFHKNKPLTLFWNGIAQIFSLGNETLFSSDQVGYVVFHSFPVRLIHRLK